MGVRHPHDTPAKAPRALDFRQLVTLLVSPFFALYNQHFALNPFLIKFFSVLSRPPPAQNSTLSRPCLLCFRHNVWLVDNNSSPRMVVPNPVVDQWTPYLLVPLKMVVSA